VEKEKIVTGKDILPGDMLIGIASNGLHSNGFSLVRKVLLDHAGLKLEAFMPELGCTLGEELLKPTVIYVPLIVPLLQEFEIKGMAHITGGGLRLNLPRILPSRVKAVLKKNSFVTPAIFSLVQERGHIEEKEMFRTFNMGIGFVLVTSPQNAAAALSQIKSKGVMAWEIGYIEEKKENEDEVEII